MLCVLICIYKWQDIQFKVDSEHDRFFEKLFMAILFSLRVFVRNLDNNNRSIKFPELKSCEALARSGRQPYSLIYKPKPLLQSIGSNNFANHVDYTNMLTIQVIYTISVQQKLAAENPKKRTKAFNRNRHEHEETQKSPKMCIN